MSPLGQFMHQLLQNHTGDVQIIDDNARLTIKQKSATLQLKRDGLHSSSLHSSSNHSTTRWEMDESNHSTEVRSKISSFNFLSSVPTAPIRKPSNDPPQGDPVLPYESLDISSHKAEKRATKYLGKHRLILSRPSFPSNLDTIFSPHRERMSWNTSSCPKKLTTLAEPTTAPNTPGPKSPAPSQPNQVVSLNLIKPSRKASPVPHPSAFELNRSLSKTLLGMDDVNPQAPKIPTRRPSKQPDGDSPARSSSADAYSQLVSDVSLSPLMASSRKNSNKSLVQQAEEMASTLLPEPPLLKNKSKPTVFSKPSGKWIRPLGKRN